MKYILDFDLTLFDSHKYLEASVPYQADGTWVTPAIWDILNASEFLYDDVLPFLEAVGKENVHILTAMSPHLGPLAREFQKEKLARCGLAEHVAGVTFMEGDKGSYIASLYDGGPTTFVDDKIEHLHSSHEHCPAVQVVQMVRQGSRTVPNEEGMLIIQTLHELSQI